MSESLTGIPARVETLQHEVAELREARENAAARIASLELKSATAGKLALMDLVKIGGIVVSVSTAVSYVVGMYVEGQVTAALQEVRVDQARTETAVDFLRGEPVGTKNDEGGAE